VKAGPTGFSKVKDLSNDRKKSYQTKKRELPFQILYEGDLTEAVAVKTCSDDLLEDSFSQYSIRKLVQVFNEKFSSTLVPLESKLKIQRSTLATSNIVDILKIGSIPLMEDAIAISRRVKLHTARLYHLFDEGFFLQGLYRFHSNWEDEEQPSRLWKCQYYLILAFGTAFENDSNDSTRTSSRSCYFERALSLLPGARACSEDPMTAVEVWCSIALYYQCLKEWAQSSVYVRDNSTYSSLSCNAIPTLIY
jgi:hypothetical protein